MTEFGKHLAPTRLPSWSFPVVFSQLGEPAYTFPKLDPHGTRSFTGLGAPGFDPHATPLVISVTLGGPVYPSSTWAPWTVNL